MVVACFSQLWPGPRQLPREGARPKRPPQLFVQASPLHPPKLFATRLLRTLQLRGRRSVRGRPAWLDSLKARRPGGWPPARNFKELSSFLPCSHHPAPSCQEESENEMREESRC